MGLDLVTISRQGLVRLEVRGHQPTGSYAYLVRIKQSRYSLVRLEVVATSREGHMLTLCELNSHVITLCALRLWPQADRVICLPCAN